MIKETLSGLLFYLNQLSLGEGLQGINTTFREIMEDR